MPVTPEEQEAERQFIREFAKKINGTIVKLQDSVDDTGTDGIIDFKFSSVVRRINIEARRKGYPNHIGVPCKFPNGWDSYCLRTGIFLNESTIARYVDSSFVFLVDIKGFGSRAAIINSRIVNELLQQPFRLQTSVNTRREQSVKLVPLNLFRKY